MLLSAKQVSKELSISEKLLAKWRYEGKNLPFIRMGDKAKDGGRGGSVRYKRSDVDAFVEASTVEVKV